MGAYQNMTIVGNLGRDAELRYTQGGQAVCSFSVAVTETWNDKTTNEKKEKTTWFKCSLWGKRGEALQQYLTKGKQVFVVGSMAASAYLDKEGKPAASLELNVRDIQLLGRREESGSSSNGHEPEEVDYSTNNSDIPF